MPSHHPTSPLLYVHSGIVALAKKVGARRRCGPAENRAGEAMGGKAPDVGANQRGVEEGETKPAGEILVSFIQW